MLLGFLSCRVKAYLIICNVGKKRSNYRKLMGNIFILERLLNVCYGSVTETFVKKRNVFYQYHLFMNEIRKKYEKCSFTLLIPFLALLKELSVLT